MSGKSPTVPVPAWCPWSVDVVQAGVNRNKGRHGQFVDGVYFAIRWALAAHPSPIREGVTGPAISANEVRYEIDLAERYPDAIRAFGDGVIAALSWLVGDVAEVVYPEDVAA